MAELKTEKNDASVDEFIDQVDHAQRKKDSYKLLQIMKVVTGEAPKMWGKSIIGFGSYHYRYKSGREGDWFLTGFSPRKQSLSVYIMSGFKRFDDLLKTLGKHKTGKGCLYINNLEDIDEKVLTQLIEASVEHLRKKNE